MLGWQVGSGDVIAGLAAIGPGAVLAALGIGLLTTVFGALRWCIVARGLGLRLPLGAAVADCYRAGFLNSVLPAGVLGDVHRAVSHGRQEGDVGRGVRAVVLERVTGNAVLVIVGVVVLLAQPALLGAALGGIDARAVLAGTAAVVVATALLAARSRRVRTVLRTARADVRAGVLARGALLWIVVLSAAAMAGYLALFVVAARTAGAHAALPELIPVLVLALLAMGLPINFGGWGPREAVASGAFGAVGLGAAQGLTTAVVYGVLSLIACLPGVVVLLLRRPGRRLAWASC